MTTLYQYILEIEEAKLFLPQNFLSLDTQALVLDSKAFDSYVECDRKLNNLAKELFSRLPTAKARKNAAVFKIVNPAITTNESPFDTDDLEWTEQIATISIAVDVAAFKKGELVKLFEAYTVCDKNVTDLSPDEIERINT
jgi:hypothetical protein